jgi:2-oxo-4-hydroxy-4-carboxy-5-ureidoimidazoline decarboxylase
VQYPGLPSLGGTLVARLAEKAPFPYGGCISFNRKLDAVMPANSPTLTLAELSKMPQEGFAAALGDIFEHAPWVAGGAAAHRPFDTVTDLHDAMLAVLAAATPEAVIGFLNNHPDLAAPAAQTPRLTAHSRDEQAAAGLGELTPEETARLARWNVEYRARFGFPFIICVRRHSQASIFAEFSRRLTGTPEIERRAALDEVARIAALRLATRVVGEGMPRVHGKLSTHLLDTARGRPAEGVKVELFVLAGDGSARLVATAVTDADGRTPAPLIDARPVPIGTYEARFSLGGYLSDCGAGRPPFLDVVPVRFTVTEPEGHYHIPLLFTPWSYTTYRGS